MIREGGWVFLPEGTDFREHQIYILLGLMAH
jgi:hypothetical protein